ncbi:AI-2E family transporter [Catelliglobosispora koreensis]|uniref:AI-2E family transporter n=1 Tax=Catelliglobosispora koreensis TaxID=129052 RepID=UPI00037AFCFC|nr:AI-2E family transporter [Catelliglobosispora koreensis]
MTRHPLLIRMAIISGCVLLIAGALYVLGFAAAKMASLLIALVAAFLIAALLEPVSHGLQRLKLPRWLASLLSVLVLIAAVIAPIALLWSLAASQFGDLAARLRDGLDRLRSTGSNVLPISETQIDQAIADVQQRFQGGTNAIASALTVAEVLAAIVLALFVAFFLLKDGPAMWKWTLQRIPAASKHIVDTAAQASWETLTRYIRGILIVALIDAIGIGVALQIIGIPLALPLALLVLVGGFVPYVGSILSGSVAVLVALAANGPVDALLTLAAVILVQQIEGNFLEPFIVGRWVRLHPVVVVVAVFAGGLIAGLAGAVIAVPLVAVAYRVTEVLRESQPPAQPLAEDS